MSPSESHAPLRAADAMDRAAGLTPSSAIYALRAERPEFLAGAEVCRTAVLTPQDDLGLSCELRAAIARRVALGSNNPALIAGYPLPQDADLARLAMREAPQDPSLIALAHHTDLIAQDPGRAREGDVRVVSQIFLRV